MDFTNYVYKKPSKLFGTQNAKTIKGEKLGYTTYILYMSPANQNTLNETICPSSTSGCRKSCLFTSGRGVFSNVIKGRLNKTEYFLSDRENFMLQVVKEITVGVKNLHKDNICVRLNGTSDIDYENISIGEHKNIMSMFPLVQFYDYTKRFDRLLTELPKNYHLTFSRAETAQNQKVCDKALQLGFNVASVFAVKDETELPKQYNDFDNGVSYDVINGDQHDLTFLHPSNSIIALKAKGRGKKDFTGFVIREF